MNLIHKLASRATPVKVGLIGAGKFGAMFLAQVPHILNLEVTAIADLDPDKVKATLKLVGWDDIRIAKTLFLTSGKELADIKDIDVVVEATGNPLAGLIHAEYAIKQHKHIVMVNVEADVLAGVRLARMAREKGVVYSMAYGDQPALVSEMVDWGRAAGFTIAAAGKGTKYHPSFHEVTPRDVWSHYGLTPEEAIKAGMNPKMFNSFLDGTKSALEMAAIANACDLQVPDDGLLFPPCGTDDLAHILRPRHIGGVLQADGMVEVVSSIERDFRPVYKDLRWGVYVILKAPTPYAAACFKQYGLITDKTGFYASMYKPFHLIGLELSISILNAALRNESTGSTRVFKGDVVSVAKRDIKADEWLDGEGGETVYGKLIPASKSFALKALPIGLAHSVKVLKPIKRGEVVLKSDVALDYGNAAVAFRELAELEA